MFLGAPLPDVRAYWELNHAMAVSRDFWEAGDVREMAECCEKVNKIA